MLHKAASVMPHGYTIHTFFIEVLRYIAWLEIAVNLPLKAQVCLIISILLLSAAPKYFFFRERQEGQGGKPYMDQ